MYNNTIKKREEIAKRYYESVKSESNNLNKLGSGKRLGINTNNNTTTKDLERQNKSGIEDSVDQFKGLVRRIKK